MSDEMLDARTVNDSWKLLFGGWIVVSVVVAYVSGLGFWGTLCGLTGLLFAVWGLRSLARSVESRSVERKDIGELGGRDEAVRIVGTVKRIDETLTAPFTGTDCIAYKALIQKYQPLH